MNPLEILLRWLGPLLNPLGEFRTQTAKLNSIHSDSVQTLTNLVATLAAPGNSTMAPGEAFTGNAADSLLTVTADYIGTEEALAGVGAGTTGVLVEAAAACDTCVVALTDAAEVAAAEVAGDAVLDEVTGAVDVAAVAEVGANPIADVAGIILTIIAGLALLGTLIALAWAIYHAVQAWQSAIRGIGDQPLPQLPPTPTPDTIPFPPIPPVPPVNQPLTPQQQRLVNDIIANLTKQGIFYNQSEIEALVRAGYGYDQIIAILRAAQYAKTHNGAAQPGYVGNRPFANDGRGGGQVLPQTTPDGTPITYREYDIYPYTKGVNRGAERIVIGSDGSIWYTSDHYKTFIKI